MDADNIKQIAKKWYKRIPFSIELEPEFDRILNETDNLTNMSFNDYDIEANKSEQEKNLIMFLYFCEEISERYRSIGIAQDIFLDTIEDFVISVQRCIDATGKIGLQKTNWMSLHLSLKLFRLGRLQFCMSKAPVDIHQKGIKEGDAVLDIHVPAGEPLLIDECRRNIEYAKTFFAEYFPDFSYSYFTCFSWLLDDKLKQFLNENSNIIQFQKLFEPVYKREEDSILHFMFKYGFTNRNEIQECTATSGFAQKVKEYALSDGVFYNVLGVREKA
ncbi:MAG: DUF5596 domain-containing protein [Clostridia bacterium]|nr:DUF5596 domain-containing protein [Clostridia bacterium]